MASTITTFSGLRCTKIARTQLFTTEVLTSAATAAPIQSGSEVSGTATILQTGSETVGTASLSGPSVTSDPTTATATAIANTVAGDPSFTSTLPTASPSNTDPSSTQAPVGSPVNSTGDDAGRNIIPAAVGGSLGAVAVIALFFLYIFLRRRRRRSVQWTSDPNAGEKTGRFGRAFGNSQLVTSLAGVLQKASTSISSRFATVTGAIGTAFSKSNDRTRSIQSPSSESPPTTQTDLATNRVSAGPQGLPTQEPRNISSATVPARRSSNPFADPPANPGIVANRDTLQVDDPFTDPSNAFNTDFDFNIEFPAEAAIRDSSSASDISSRYSRSVAPRVRTASSSLSRQTNGSQWRLERGISTRSDPFDLDRPPTIHSSVNPTPKIDEKFRAGYFPDTTPKLT